MNNQTSPRARVKRGIYLLPNLATTGALFFGFFAIITAIDLRFERAILAIFMASLFDMLDGRIARWTKSESLFGANYDTLSDVISFGIAPSILAYQWGLNALGKYGFAISFLIAATTVLRLARFNAQVETQKKDYFQGLPSPAAAGMIASTIYWIESLTIDLSVIFIPIAVITSMLMVSNIRFISPKKISVKKRIPFFSLVLIALFFLSISLNPPLLIFSLCLLYTLSGPLLTLYKIRQFITKRQQQKQKTEEQRLNSHR